MTTAPSDPGFAEEVELFAPGGSSLSFTKTWQQWTLSAPGTYTLRVKEYRADPNPAYRQGKYVQYMQVISPVSKQCTAAPISCGQTKTATLGLAAEDLYTFNG